MNECKIIFPSITQIAFSEMEYLSNNDSTVFMPTFYIQKEKKAKLDMKQLTEWLKLRSGRDTVNLIY